MKKAEKDKARNKKKEEEKQSRAIMKAIYKAEERELARKEKEEERESLIAIVEGKRKEKKRKRNSTDAVDADAANGDANADESKLKKLKSCALHFVFCISHASLIFIVTVPITERYLASSPNRQEEIRSSSILHRLQ